MLALNFPSKQTLIFGGLVGEDVFGVDRSDHWGVRASIWGGDRAAGTACFLRPQMVCMFFLRQF